MNKWHQSQHLVLGDIPCNKKTLWHSFTHAVIAANNGEVVLFPHHMVITTINKKGVIDHLLVQRDKYLSFIYL
ncbi:hypothetical protein [Photobacterium carnosum]|uniref:hypothetical protein n=1 Tax=Photobacterium carnosum TaxID=2023717 RepID=UPI00128B5D71|nr:hypothetical protein [Photobacterium carnosum]KAE8177425.1 hypothetical protein CIT27_06750 [Photobacterium carnosum]MCD9516689.1 hypothetical protein [Photobacterium carnosum]MCD9552248.1 hypothetical protein [Photobacterium carnosum]MCD9555141.1 hypothetical protein [Photobacterium carnosum]